MKAILFSLMLTTTLVQGQDSVRTKTEFLVNGSFGMFFPLSSSSSFKTSGGVFAFQMQANFVNRQMVRLSFDQYNIGYNASFTKGVQRIEVEDQVALTFIGLDWGMLFPKGKWSPYFYIGAGAGLLDLPALAPTDDASIKLVHSVSLAGALRAGLGVDYSLSRYFIIYAEAQGVLLPEQRVLQDATYGLNLQVGVKTPLTY